jgi:pyridinium-3,5-biscarboxylic acid mononucleotide synthase
MVEKQVTFDFARRNRTGISEAVLCEGKSAEQINHIISIVAERGQPLLLTRLNPRLFESLGDKRRPDIDYDPVSHTGIFGRCARPVATANVAVVAAGSSDIPVVREASRTLWFHGEAVDEFVDVGVAGLWRITEKQEQLRFYRVIIVVAGMDGALFSVLGGLVDGVVIAVPTATGYGVAHGGVTALNAALASCAPGIVVANIGNGYGGACAAIRVLRAIRTKQPATPPI